MGEYAVQDEYFGEIAQQTAAALGLGRDYEHEQLEHFGKLLKGADRFIDVGANHGLYSRLASRTMQDGHIAMVEANPGLAEELEREISSWPNERRNKIEVFPFAAGDISTKLPFIVDESDDLSAVALSPPNQAEGGVRPIEVECKPLDELFAPAPRTLIKIDVEGFEYRVITGAKRLLSPDDTRVILELHGWGDGKKFPVHVVWLMFRLGFSCSQIGTSYSCDCLKVGFPTRALALARAWPKLALRYAVRRLGLRPIIYRLLWPDSAERAAR